MKLCCCHKVWHVKSACKDCGSSYAEMAPMPKGRYVSNDLIVKVNARGDVNVIKLEGKSKIHASIKYSRGNYETA